MAIVNMTDPLADQWAIRHNAEPTVTHIVGVDDIAFATGDYVEFDDTMDYLDKRQRLARSKPNSYRAEGQEAEIESDLVGAACHLGNWGKRAVEQLRQRGYVISADESEFAQVRQRWQEFMSEDHRDCE